MMNEQIQAAVQALRLSAAKGKTKKAHLENIENISSATVLLNSSQPSFKAFSKLASLLRAPFIPLYISYTETALKTAAAILEVLTEKLRLRLDEDSILEKDVQEGWEKAAYSLLSGVIDYLESDATETGKAAISSALYKPLCSFFFDEKTISSSKVDATLKSTAFILLSDSSASHPANQAKLRTLKMLGGMRLGTAISQTKDYVVLEALLNLFARLLPSSSAAKAKHTQFVQEVFGKAFSKPNVSKSIQKVLVHASAKDWEETATKLFDIFASADISFPQPFDVRDVVVCGNTYPQPNVSDRFFIDRSAFFVNVEQEDGLYESLLIYFSTVQRINMAAKGESVSVTATLNIVPKLADQPIGKPTSGTKSLELQVEIRERDSERFIQALRHRKLGHCVSGSARKTTPVRKSRVSVTESSALLEFRADGKEWESEPLAFDKIKEVESFYDSAFDKSMSPDKNEQSKPFKQGSSTNIGHASVNPATEENNGPAIRTKNALETDLSVGWKILHGKGFRDTKEKGSTGRRLSSRQLRISVLDDGNDALSDVDELEQGTADKETQAVDSANINEESSIEATPRKEREVLRKVAHRCIVSDEEQEISETEAEIKKATRAMRPSATTSSSTRKTQGASSGKDTKVRLHGKPRAANKVAKKALGNLENTSAVQETPEDNNNALTEDKPAREFKTDERPSQDNIVPGTPNTDRNKDTRKVTSHRSGKKPPNAATGKNNIDHDDVNPLLIVNKKTAEPAAFEPALHSSPLSRVSKMKSKYGGKAAKQSKTNPKKRPAEDTVPIECPPSPKRKKPYSVVPEKVGSDSGRLSSKYRAQGRATKDNKKDIDWEQIPSSDARIAFHPSSPTTFKLASKKVGMKNVDKLPVKIVEIDLKTQADVKEVARPKETTSKRGPLREKDINIPLELRQKNSLNEHGIGNKQNKGTATALEGIVETENMIKPQSITAEQKDSILPSLEDVLLRGATLTMTHPDTAIIEPEEIAEVATGGEILENDHEASEDADTTDKPALDDFPAVADIMDKARPLTPVSDDVVELPIVIGSSQPVMKTARTTKQTKPRVIDLTEDMVASNGDIRKVPLPAKKLEGKNQSLVTNLETPTHGYSVASLSADVVELKNTETAKAKVKFDEKPRYKSASFEGLIERAKGERYHGDSARKKMDLMGNRIGREFAPVQKEFDGTRSKEPGMSEIISVINSIQDAIISNIANKSRAVRSDIRIARDKLLHEAMSDLQDMRVESIGHYNNLISLETEYANASRKLVNSYEAVENVNLEICTCVQQSIKAHDRKTSSKNLPQSLFAAGLPSLFKH